MFILILVSMDLACEFRRVSVTRSRIKQNVHTMVAATQRRHFCSVAIDLIRMDRLVKPPSAFSVAPKASGIFQGLEVVHVAVASNLSSLFSAGVRFTHSVAVIPQLLY
jgi:hypothetical protein